MDLAETTNRLPVEVYVRSEQARILLEPTLIALEVGISVVDSLPQIEEVQQSLFSSR